jgi:Uma2 family endonuclease
MTMALTLNMNWWMKNSLQERITIGLCDRAFYDLTEFQGEALIQSPSFPTLKLTAAQILTGKL